REDHADGGRDLPDEDHQARAGGAEDRPLDSRVEERRVPRRLGELSGERGRRHGDARGSLQEPVTWPRADGWWHRVDGPSNPRPYAISHQPSAMDGALMTNGSMTKAELVEEVSRVSDLTKKHSEVIVDTVFRSIIEALHRGEKIELRGFGSFRL